MYDNEFDDNSNIKPDKDDKFISLLMLNQQRIYGFIRMLVPQKANADDVMQETVTIMWRKFDTFALGTDFVAWGIKIAKFRIMKFRGKKKNEKIRFTDQAMDQLLAKQDDTQKNVDDRILRLENCLKKLSDNDKRLIQMRYDMDLKPKLIADRVGRSFHGIYKSLSRIHYSLMDCVSRATKVGDRDGN
ncbi:MAG: sigma-70 family RNA polymerase sigma factor [Phycisphaerae bacterium]|nr:sigma-70 family RNA polymerase sigma factor [Phycisphaerae bacterium]